MASPPRASWRRRASTRALAALKRFRALARQIGAKHVYAVATAAAREASNGAQFIAKAEKALGCDIKVLTGKEEARYAALGVIAGIPGADGVVGDLGGGSLELIDIKDGKLRDGITLPLGPLRLIDLSGGSIDKAREIIDETFAKTGHPQAAQGPHLLCGGRHLAKPRQAAHGAEPLSAACAALLPAHQAAGHVAVGARRPSLAHLAQGNPRGLEEPLRHHALRRAGAGTPARTTASRAAVEISVYGVREGLLYSKLPGRKRNSDALLSSCWDFARRYARSPEHELELCDWTDQLFGPGKLPETDEQRRLRYAACLLADIGWRAHPDYRAERSLSMISQAAFVGIDHPGRVFLALTVFYRYDGEGEDGDGLNRLLDDEDHQRAHLLSSMFRLAYILSAAMPGMLPNISLKLGDNKTLILRLPRKLADLAGERVEKRLAGLAAEMGRTGKLVIGR